MSQLQFKNALISVADKTGLVDFVKPLAENGMRILSTGGTAKLLQEAGVEVVKVSEQTGFPEVMDGRVKTLHPNIHMCLLARAYKEEDLSVLSENGLEPIDLVVGNLYPFEQALTRDLQERELSEFIDIGGPSFLRAAAKSFERITVICDPSDYTALSEKGEVTQADRKRLAAKLFAHTSSYDAMIANQMAGDLDTFCLGGEFVDELRYGENPQQFAGWFRQRGAKTGLHEAEILQGKALSYNNILDLESAIAALNEFQKDEICAVSVKHNNPCGVGIGESGEQAVERSLAADPVSVFGGIVAVNTAVTAQMAEKMSTIFLECVVAPEVRDEARDVFAKKKNLRVLEWPKMSEAGSAQYVKSLSGGYLVQSQDKVEDWSEEWKILGESPSDEIRQAIRLSWRVCAHLKSNAIAISSAKSTVGLGMGQVNRVDAVDQAIQRMKAHHEGIENVVLSSDAFFPFADSIEVAAKAGIKWVVQPGGSIRDEEVFAKAKELGVNLVLTHRRHFKH